MKSALKALFKLLHADVFPRAVALLLTARAKTRDLRSPASGNLHHQGHPAGPANVSKADMGLLRGWLRR